MALPRRRPQQSWSHQPDRVPGPPWHSRRESLPSAPLQHTRTRLTRRRRRAHRGKAARYSGVTLEDRSAYFAASCKPICKLVEDDLEELSGVVTCAHRLLATLLGSRE